ncbi:Gfo/Idh/MocA family protein [Commensalibacter oyaizuii]|uniref:Gfo/Idh/MocA family oxidoreductase n=1 Tax=Commensalibacter oyaizuii TaxID=3043873 RepID=A0ABT6PZ46_9PROT|nr:Gfo/Idh/MocA family oxidoreductase [Commensalibacter sp. TBRC 16381]MDI2090126.1 Gfo/Idh/MocA family oxidoreductase [Commensalibacter sp. TBRC 16381]
MAQTEILRVGIAGAGYFGRFHALKVFHSRREQLVGIYDPIIDNAKKVGKEAGGAPYLPLDELLLQCDALIIAAPAEEHYPLAVKAIQAGKHVLIEKPIASTLEQADHLIDLSKQTGTVLQVGHLLRYSAEQKAISERIKRPLYIETTRIAPFKPRGVDVSVVLDLMIHDLDLVMAIVNSPIERVDALGAAVTSEFEDIANARVTFQNGCVATIAASRISLKTERKMRIFSEEGYLSADFMEKQLVMIGREKGLPLPGTNGFRREAVKWKDHDNLEQEHAAFAASCLDGEPVIVDALAGRNALKAALAVINSVKESRERMQASGLLSPKKISF